MMSLSKDVDRCPPFSIGDSDEAIQSQNTATQQLDPHFSLSGSSESLQTIVPSLADLAAGRAGLGQLGVGSPSGLGDQLTAHRPGQPDKHQRSLSRPVTATHSSVYEAGDFFSSFNFVGGSSVNDFDGGEFGWHWLGLNSIESPSASPSSESDVDTSNSPISQPSYYDLLNTSPQSITHSPPTSLDYSFGLSSPAQPFDNTEPLIADSSASGSSFGQIDYNDLFGYKPTPTRADDHLFNGGSIPTGLIFPPLVPAQLATAPGSGYRDQAADLDASLCSPLDVSPPTHSLGDFGSALLGDFSPDESFSQLATPQLDFSHLNVDGHDDGAFDSVSLFGSLPGQDFLVNVSAHQGMVSIKEEPEEDNLASTSATPELDTDWDKPTSNVRPPAPVHNTRKRKPIEALPDFELDSSPPVESPSQPLKRARRALSSAPPVLPLDAPIQPRKYHGDSKTSRKVLPKAIERSLGRDARNRDPNDLQADVDSRRAQNTLAARKSRQRKAEELNSLKSENDELRERIAQYEARFGEL